MAVYKVTYECKGTYWDFTMSSDRVLTVNDDEVMSAAIEDSINIHGAGNHEVSPLIGIIMVTEEK
ncbi:hypothetical protein QOM18_12035 [Serratia marcescens]|uniref:hypothetical protein n=1 Tax=Serratia marcescens TaxID=615 RepID=UPI0024C4B7E5|nr:hypothetical protein [Serratia marcescens]MDK1709038.1 hypothetical protein [Serratia marcescens]